MRKIKKLLPPNFLLIYLLLEIILYFVFPLWFIPIPYRIVGILFIILGVVLNLWADNLFKKGKTTVKPDKIPTRLITNGSFRISRHPMYLGFVLLLLGVSILLGSLTSFTAPVLMFITLQTKFITHEENQMKKVFGEKYREYEKRVRRWI